MISRFAAALAVSSLCCAGPALAHPHVWVVGSTDILFDEHGRLSALKQRWTFDEMYSAFAVQGLGQKGQKPSREDLAPLAKTNVESLSEFGYFTAARQAGKRLEWGEPKDYSLEVDDKGLVSLSFTLPFKEPIEARKPLSFQTFDPTFFVSFSADKAKPASLVGAPSGCSMSAVEPAPLLANEQSKLAQAASDNFSPGADLSIKLATRVVVACP